MNGMAELAISASMSIWRLTPERLTRCQGSIAGSPSKNATARPET
jgi:hypothetical protein